MKRSLVQFLLWSQKYTKMDMLYLARGSFWILFNQGIQGGLVLALVVGFANILPKEVYGQYSYILSVLGALNILTLTGINTAVSRAVAKGKTHILRGTVQYQLRWNVLLCISLLGLGGYYFLKEEQILALSFIALALFTPATLAFNTYGAYLEGRKEFRRVSVLRTLSAILYVGSMFGALIFSGETVVLVTTYAAINFMMNAIFYMYTIRKFNYSDSSDVSSTVRYGRELTYIQFIDPVAAQIDKIIIGHFWGPAQLAVYALAQTIPNKLNEYIKSWVSIGFPKFAEKTPREIHSVFYRRILQGCTIGFLVTSFYIVLSPYLFKYILPQYLDSIFYSQIFCLSFIVALPNRYMSLLFSSQKLSGLILKRSLIVNCMNITLYIVCGLWGGVLGLVVASVILAFLCFILNLVLWLRVAQRHQ